MAVEIVDRWEPTTSGLARGGRRIKSFEAVDDDENVYTITEYLLTITSKEVRPDHQVASPPREIRHWRLANGGLVQRNLDDRTVYRIVRSKVLLLALN